MGIQEKVKEQIGLYVCRHKNRLDFFIAKPLELKDTQTPQRQFYDVADISTFEDICKKYRFTVSNADARAWFEQGAHFCVLTEGDHYGCWGWYATAPQEVYVLEIDRRDRVPENAALLYHAYTNPECRRQGFYCDLLQRMAASCDREYCLGYAYAHNTASTGAIHKTGFRFVASYGHRDFPGFRALLDQEG